MNGRKLIGLHAEGSEECNPINDPMAKFRKTKGVSKRLEEGYQINRGSN